MRRITAISLLVASAAATFGALPAGAQGLRSADRPQLQRSVVTRTACAASFADPRCGLYQRRMIAAVANTPSARPLSIEEAGKRQLDALLRTID